MGAPVGQASGTGATVPTGYPPPAQQYPSAGHYPPGPQYPAPQYPSSEYLQQQQYGSPQAQPQHQQQQYTQQQYYTQPGGTPKAQPAYVQQPVPAVGVPAGPVPVTYASTLQAQPNAGMATRGPARPPAPGDVLLGYEICQPETGCCKCEGLSFAGVLAVILLLFFFFPLACLPCCLPECYEPYQRPVYGRRP